MKVALLMTEENIVGREILEQAKKQDIKIGLIIVEQSKRAESEKEYLKNDFYTPQSFNECIQGHDAEVVFVPSLNKEEAQQKLEAFAPDITLLDGSAIIKENIFTIAGLGTINSHPGILPDYRGVDSVRWAIYHGQPIGGTAHFIDNGLDTGPILTKREVKYSFGESLLEIRVRVMRVCIELMIEAVSGLKNGTLKPIIQKKEEGGYYSWAPKETQDAVDEILHTGKRKEV